MEMTTIIPVTLPTNNESTDYNNDYAQPPSPENVQILFGFYIFSLISAIITNGTFIGLTVQHRKSWTAHDILILNISVSDLYYVISFGWILLPAILPNVPRPFFASNSIYCRFLMTSCALSFYVNMYLLSASAMASYLKIKQSRIEITTKRAWWAIFTIYVISVISLASPTFGFWGKLSYYPNLGICMFSFSPHIRLDQILYAFCILYPTFLINFNVIAFCYYGIYKVVRKSSKAIAQHKFNQANYNGRKRIETNFMVNNTTMHRLRKPLRSDITLAKTLLTVFSLIMFSYSPYAISNILHFISATKNTITVDLYLLLISCSNSIFNPIIFYTARRRRRTKTNLVNIKNSSENYQKIQSKPEEQTQYL